MGCGDGTSHLSGTVGTVVLGGTLATSSVKLYICLGWHPFTSQLDVLYFCTIVVCLASVYLSAAFRIFAFGILVPQLYVRYRCTFVLCRVPLLLRNCLYRTSAASPTGMPPVVLTV